MNGFNQSFSFSQSCGFASGFSYEPALSYLSGIKRDYYNVGYYDDDPRWFSHESPAYTTYPISVIEEPLDVSDPPDNFSVRWTGYFKAPTSETYTFYLESDDASAMWIGDAAKIGWRLDNALIDNSGVHGAIEKTASVNLTAGTYYPLQVVFGESTGGSILTFSYSTPMISKTTDLSGLIYHSPNLDPFLRGIENKTSTTLITSGSITVNGTVFSWPTFDIVGNDPAGWNTLLVQGVSPPQKVYSILGAGAVGGPPQVILDFVGRGDLAPGTPLVCTDFVSATGSIGIGDYGVRSESFLGTPGTPVFSFTDYLSGNIYYQGEIGSPPFTWASTYNSPPPDPLLSLIFLSIDPKDSKYGGSQPAVMLIFVAPS